MCRREQIHNKTESAYKRMTKITWSTDSQGDQRTENFQKVKLYSFIQSGEQWVLRMWSNWNSCAMLVGMQNGATTLENSLAAS